MYVKYIIKIYNVIRSHLLVLSRTQINDWISLSRNNGEGK